MKAINLTPHELRIRINEAELVLPPAEVPARVEVEVNPVQRYPKWIDGTMVPVVANKYGAISGLPAPQEGTIFIVSIVVLGLVKGREDVFAPDTGATAIRYTDGPHKGQIAAVTRLIATQ